MTLVVYVMSKVTIAVYGSDILVFSVCVAEQFIIVVYVIAEVSMLLYIGEMINAVVNLLQ